MDPVKTPDSAPGTVGPAPARQQGTFISIVEDNEQFTWQFRDPDTGVVWDSKFTLRTVPETLQKKWRKEFTKPEFRRGQRHEIMDATAFADRCLDYAIVGWADIKHPTRTNPDGSKQDLPCTSEWKIRLPERVQAEIIRLCVGKELGNDVAQAADDADEGSLGSQRP